MNVGKAQGVWEPVAVTLHFSWDIPGLWLGKQALVTGCVSPAQFGPFCDCFVFMGAACSSFPQEM